MAKCKQLGQTHEHEIDTLLKFNEKLIGIIESEFNASSKSKISDLQPISEAIEKEPDPGLGIRMHNKLMKSMANTPTHFITN